MTRVPLDLVVTLLNQSGITVSTATLRQWKHRNLISRGAGYDLDEIAAVLKRRKAAA